MDQATGYDPPGSPAASYSYDLDRRLTGINFASGGAVDLSHDTENRLLSVNTSDDDLALTYVPGTTHVAGISRTNGQSNSYTYDGFLPLSQSWSGVVTGNVSYDYDADFRIDSLSVNGAAISYGYDGDSLLTQAGALTASRDPANGLLTSTSLDTISTNWSYNGFGEPVAYEATDGANTLFREEMDRDLLGRITQKRETFGTTTTVTDYGYDETGRLVWVDIDGNRAVTWTYDSNDNRLTAVTSSGTKSGTYDDQDRLLSYGSSSYTWNDDGDLVTRTTNSFVETFDFDVFGNLVTYSSPSIDIEYVIDGQNRRVGKRINGTLAQGFLYADQLNPVAELDGSGSIVSTFVYGTRPNTPDTMIQGGNTYRVISDHLGSVRLVVDASTGAIAQRMDYDAWGRVVYDPNPGFQPFGFAGGLYDRHTGLTRFGARDYDPQTGRWTAKDPVLFAGGDTNLYRYAAGDPVNWVDPSGLYRFEVHFKMTYHWALDAGFDAFQAHRVARANQRMDDNWRTSPWNPFSGTPQHFRRRGEITRKLWKSIIDCDIEGFGSALHSWQDSYSHAPFGPVFGHFWTSEPDDYDPTSGREINMEATTRLWLGLMADRLQGIR